MADDSLEGMSPEQRDELARLTMDIANNPKTRGLYLRAVKEAKPGTPIPELDLENRVLDAVRPYAKKTLELEQKLVETAAKNRVVEARQALADDGYSKDEIDQIEALMVEEKKSGSMLNHKTAANFFKMRQQTAAPTPASLHTMQLPRADKAAVKEAGGFKQFYRGEAHRAIDDIRSGKIKLH